MKRRLRILLLWLTGHRNGVSVRELFAFLLAPRTSARAATLITSLEPADQEMLCATVRGADRPLYYPSTLKRSSLDHVVAAALRPEEWHYYETPGTRVRPDDIVIDAGAAEGMFTLVVYDRCDHVYSVEPLESYVATLTRTFADAGNVEVIGAALGARPGEATFVSDGTGSHIEAGSEGVAVTVDTVDSLFVDQGRRFTYLKADLEGWELDMLEGARRSLAEYLPRVSITTYHAPDHARLIADFLHEIDPRYTTTVRGIEDRWGAPVMLHAWIDEPEDAPEA